MFRNINVKSVADMVSEWDTLAAIRLEQITSGIDISYRQILVPSILTLASREPAGLAIDAGCGVGFLTDLLAAELAEIVGIDPSPKSIEIARAFYGNKSTFFIGTLEDYSKHNRRPADLVIANMVIMDVIDLDEFIEAAYKVLHPGGALIFSATHPCFWPSYYGYANEPWYQYDKELIIESPFRITAEPDCPLLSTHVHRPLSTYVQSFRKCRFSIEVLNEPMPSPNVEAQYPEPWAYPRYLVGLCRRL